MPQFSEEVLKRMQEKAQAQKQRLAGSGADFGRYAGLSGKNAIVAPGEGVAVRLLPKWDFAAKRFTKDKAGKTVENPKYVREECYFPAFEHWFDNKDGKRQRAWCRKNLGEDELCPLCEASVALRAGRTEEEKLQARDLAAKETYLFNVILRATPFGEDGKPAVRILSAPATVWVGIMDYCTGGGDAKFALGDVSDPWEGHDMQIFRPAGQGDRYRVQAAVKATPLHEKADAAKWAGWHSRLYDLEKDVLDDVPTTEQMEKDFYGEAQGGGGVVGDQAAGGRGTPGVEDYGFGTGPAEPAVPEISGGDENPFGDIGMPGEAPDTPAPRKPVPAPARSAAPRQTGRGRR